MLVSNQKSLEISSYSFAFFFFFRGMAGAPETQIVGNIIV